MATITPPRSTNLAQAHERVRNPLQRLRKYIRTYVWLEGAAVFLLFLALWFWIGLLLDYGTFRVFNGFDWIKVVPWVVRLVVLILLAGAATVLVASKVFTRLFSEFKDAALALLLERKFPNLLGDRLITAVELSDPEACRVLGFSPAMVRETIHEAAERVEKVPVREVFDWRRLYRYGLVVLLLTFVAAGVALGGFIAVGKTAKHGYYNFRNVSAIWFERNILLKKSYWDLRSQVELLEPSDTNLRIARDDPAPEVHVVAYKYVIADRDAPNGWRPVTWKDLETRPELLGTDLSDLSGGPPGDWKARSGDSISLDDIEARLDRFPIRRDGNKWLLADAQATGGWRPLRWSDLTPDRIGGFAVPTLSARWDPSAIPIHAAAIVGMNASAGASAAVWRAATVERLGSQFLDADLDDIEARLDTIAEEGTTLRFLGDPVHFIQADVVQRFSPLTVPEVVVASLGLGNLPGAALVSGFSESKSKAVGLSYIFSRLERLTELRGVVERVAKRADEPEMGRTLRELKVPTDAVYLVYKGANTSTRVNLKRSGDNIFSGTFKDLKVEKTRYWVEAENYESDTRTVEVLPPPAITSLFCDQYHPAYLYYRPGTPNGIDLKGVKQKMKPMDLSSTSGNITRITQLPAGSDVVLRGSINETLKNDSDSEDGFKEPAVRIVPRGGSILNFTGLTWKKDRFQVEFKNVRERQDFTLIFRDHNGVKGTRQVEISPKPDTEPSVEGFEPETVRKTPEGFKITANARIPFIGVVQDGQGLSRVRFAYTIEPEKTGTDATKGNVVMVFGLPIKLPAEAEVPVNVADAKYRDLPAFQEELRKDSFLDERGRVFLSPERRKDMLAEAQEVDFRNETGKRRLVARFQVKPDEWIKPLNPTETRAKWKYPRADSESGDGRVMYDFPVWELGVKAAGNKVQPHYKLRLRMEAVDTDLDSETDKDGTPKPHVFATNWFTFRIVSEGVLLSEIAREEDELRKKFVEMFENLQNREVKLAEVCSKLDRGAFKNPEVAGELEKEVLAMIGSLSVTSVALDKSKEVAVAVRKDYERILKELRVNQVELSNKLSIVSDHIVEPLLQIEADEFPAAAKAVVDFGKSLDRSKSANNVTQVTSGSREAAKTAQLRVAELKEKLRTVLDAMDKISNLNILIEKLVKIEASERDQQELYEKIKRDLIEQQLKELTDPKK